MKRKLIKYLAPVLVGVVAGIILEEPIKALIEKAKDAISSE